MALRLKFLSFNILAPIWIHPTYFPGVTAHGLNHQRRLTQKIRTIRDTNADVVFLQEVQADEYVSICSAFDQSYDHSGLCKNSTETWKDWLKGNQHQDNGVLVLLKKGLFADVKIEQLNLSEDGNMGCAVHCTSNNFPMVLINTHLETSSVEQREKQTHRIQKFINETIQKQENTIIWAGDFNEERSGTNIQRILKQTGYHDLLRTFETITTCSTVKRRLAIDYIILMSGSPHPPKIIDCSVPQSIGETPIECLEWNLANFGSDHLPIQATVLLRE